MRVDSVAAAGVVLAGTRFGVVSFPPVLSRYREQVFSAEGATIAAVEPARGVRRSLLGESRCVFDLSLGNLQDHQLELARDDVITPVNLYECSDLL